MKKRVISLLLAGIMTLSLLPTAAFALTPAKVRKTFSDLPSPDFPITKAATWAYYEGITAGTSDTEFNPKGFTTRGQIVTFLWRYKGSPEPTSQNNPFSDVKPNDYYYKAILWAVEQGITQGTSATTFSPGKICGIGEVVTFTWRAEGKPRSAGAKDFIPMLTGRFGDAYFNEAFAWADDKGYIGIRDNYKTLEDVNKPCKRGFVVELLFKIAVKHGEHPLLDYGTPLTKFTSSIPRRTPYDKYSDLYGYYISLDIAGTQVLTMGDKGTNFTFTEEGTLLTVQPSRHLSGHTEIYNTFSDSNNFVLGMDIAGGNDSDGTAVGVWEFEPFELKNNQVFVIEQAKKDSAGNIRAYIKSKNGNYIQKTNTGLVLTSQKSKATPFYFIDAIQTREGQRVHLYTAHVLEPQSYTNLYWETED